MTRLLPLLACVFVCSWSTAASVPHPHQQEPAPIERRSPPSSPQATVSPDTGVRAGTLRPAPIERHQPPRGEHLAEWMDQHRNLTPQQQQDALGHEPGFNALSRDTQQRMRERLAQLDAMTPDQRQRLLARNEAMERLTPAQRGDVRSAMSQLGSLPADQRITVARTFRALRDLPPEQRISALNSGRFGPPMNDAQRTVMYNLLRVEPMLPPPNAATAQPARPPVQ